MNKDSEVGTDISAFMRKVESAGLVSPPKGVSGPSVKSRPSASGGAKSSVSTTPTCAPAKLGNKNNKKSAVQLPQGTSPSPTSSERFSSSLYRPTTSSSLKGRNNNTSSGQPAVVSPLSVPLVNTDNFYQVGGAIYSKRPQSATPAAPYRRPLSAASKSLGSRPKSAKSEHKKVRFQTFVSISIWVVFFIMMIIMIGLFQKFRLTMLTCVVNTRALNTKVLLLAR